MTRLFQCDYHEGAHPRVMERLLQTNLEQTVGYGEDAHCRRAAELIRQQCRDASLDVHFLVGGTQTNATVIAAALRPYQGVISADTGHINVHETGAVEAMGHKVLQVAERDGKLMPEQVEAVCLAHGHDEHMVQPKMVYISNPTELGTLYTKQELQKLQEVCKKYDLLLFLDGARLGYGLAAPENDLNLETIAACCDVFYIGGTKVGALFGEAVVIRNEALKQDFRYVIKQKGGMLAKGRLLGIQFETLFEETEGKTLYESISAHAIDLAQEIREALRGNGYPFLVESGTNQIFVVMPDEDLKCLEEQGFAYQTQSRIDKDHQAVRLCTSWATRKEDVQALTEAFRALKEK